MAIYPQYETRGELSSAVARFREWLQNTVIDLEVSAQTPHPVVDPRVHTILVGHSMGGIVAADALLAILDDDAVAGNRDRFPFPHVTGILAFDTPYLGLATSVLAHSAEGKWKTASTAYSSFSSIASGMFASQAAVEGTSAAKTAKENDEHKARNELSQQSLWGGWGKVAAYSGAAAALAGGAAAAYIKRDDISAGFGWVSSHLEFVGALMKAEELKNRVERASTFGGIGFANLFTSLGGERLGSSMLYEGKERTFCSLPADESPLRRKFFRCVNAKADDEVGAHCSMFEPHSNPAYFELADRAMGLVCLWITEGAYLPVNDEEEEGAEHEEGFGRYSSGAPPRRSSSFYERESSSSKSKSRSRHGSRDHGKPSSSSSSPSTSRRSSHGVGPLERSDSGLSVRSGHYDKERKEKKEKKERSNEKPKLPKPGSFYDRDSASPMSSGYGSGKDREKDKAKDKNSRRKSSSSAMPLYQMDHDSNPWR